ncbi:hypothetical protein BpHYR1_012346 [Brachionus plicatilis]|uniref:Uncharacterized protein n=1 Tax=Brachionus plicatilis TaxID=10195 RepID=A0A3M7PLZ9_BRAPC|nr:hypothetical protein BpHYR1_012346 [Brachionus plicatilis]
MKTFRKKAFKVLEFAILIKKSIRFFFHSIKNIGLLTEISLSYRTKAPSDKNRLILNFIHKNLENKNLGIHNLEKMSISYDNKRQKIAK